MNSYDVAIPGSSYNYLEWCRNRPVGESKPMSEINTLPTTSLDNKKLKYWNYYILESESSQSSDDGSETALSIQGKETDRARDTSDLDSDGTVLEYEVMSSDDDGMGELPQQFVDSHQSSSDDDLVDATVIHAVLAEGDFMFADSEDSMSAPSTDPELSPFDYWNCAQCRNTNNNPMFRYCEKCYKVRKDFFPPPPKHKRRKNRKRNKKQRKTSGEVTLAEATTQDSRTQSQGTGLHLQRSKSEIIPSFDLKSVSEKVSNPVCVELHSRKRKNECSENEIDIKKLRADLINVSVIKNNVNKNIILSESYNAQRVLDIGISEVKEPTSFSQPLYPEFGCNVQPVSKSMSDPAINFSKDDIDVISESLNHFSDNDTNLSSKSQKSVQSNQSDMCITCLVEPKSGVFVHGRIAHICCCYKCSVKVWMKTKRCPICNCKVSNVLKAFVM